MAGHRQVAGWQTCCPVPAAKLRNTHSPPVIPHNPGTGDCMKLEFQIRWGFVLAPSSDTLRNGKKRMLIVTEQREEDRCRLIRQWCVCCKPKTFSTMNVVLLSPGPRAGVDPGATHRGRAQGTPALMGPRLRSETNKKRTCESEKPGEGSGNLLLGQSSLVLTINQSEKENKPAGQTPSIPKTSRALRSRGHRH